VVSETDRDLALIVLGLALASREMLDAVKKSLKGSDFGKRLMMVAHAILENDKAALSKEVESLWGVKNGNGKLGFAFIEELANRAAKKNLGTLVNSLVLRTQVLDTEKAKQAITELTAVLKKLGETK
jgi:hypothetical protein